MIDGLISAFLGGYLFLYGSGYISRKPPKDPEDDSFERMSPFLKGGGALVFAFGVIGAGLCTIALIALLFNLVVWILTEPR